MPLACSLLNSRSAEKQPPWGVDSEVPRADTPDSRLPDLVQPSTDTIGMLRELVDALDRRVPHAERVGETRIARDAAALRSMALSRLEELTRTDTAPTKRADG